MDVNEVWRHTHEQRHALAALLRDLSDDEWAVLSLCEEWTVREVAAHVMRSATVTAWESAAGLVAFRGTVQRHGGRGCPPSGAASRG